MAAGAEEVEALYDLIGIAITDLKAKDPQNELLDFAAQVTGEANWDEEVSERFLKLFAPSEETTVLQARMKYLVALETATGRRPDGNLPADPR